MWPPPGNDRKDTKSKNSDDTAQELRFSTRVPTMNYPTTVTSIKMIETNLFATNNLVNAPLNMKERSMRNKKLLSQTHAQLLLTHCLRHEHHHHDRGVLFLICHHDNTNNNVKVNANATTHINVEFSPTYVIDHAPIESLLYKNDVILCDNQRILQKNNHDHDETHLLPRPPVSPRLRPLMYHELQVRPEYPDFFLDMNLLNAIEQCYGVSFNGNCYFNHDRLMATCSSKRTVVLEDFGSKVPTSTFMPEL